MTDWANITSRDQLIFEALLLEQKLKYMREDKTWDPEDFDKEKEILNRLKEIKKQVLELNKK